MAVIDCEVAVVGAGPCGSFAATTAASLGRDVVMVEEHKEVGIPDHCAGHISIKGLERLKVVPPRDCIENEIKRARFYSPSGKSLTIECDKSRVYVLDRSLFDQYLAQQATQRGAKLQPDCRAQKLYMESKAVRGVETTLGQIRADVVIDAEGSHCSLLREGGISLPDRSNTVTGAQCIVEEIRDVEENTVEIYLGNEYAPGFYAWVIPRRDGSGKIGLGTCRGNPKQTLSRFLELHPIASGKIKGNVKNYAFHPIPLSGPKKKTFYAGLIIVGDAASQVKPTTGGGVIHGMMCARHAGAVANRAIETVDTSEHFLSQYQMLWKTELSKDFYLGQIARRALNRLSDRAIDRIFDVGDLLGVEESFGSIEEIDSASSILSHAIRKPRVVAALLGSLIVSIFS